MIYLIFSLIFGLNCDSLTSRLYNVEMEFKNVKTCRCISWDVLADYKSQAKKSLKTIRQCDSLRDEADSVWREIKKYKN